jgi:hypothetical protein
MFKNVMNPLIESWFSLLNGNLSYNSIPVNVYPEDPDNNDTNHHVLIRAESETDDSNKHSFITRPVIVIDIITFHDVSINRTIVDNIDEQIRELVFPTRKCALPPLNGLQITNVIPEGGSYLTEDDGTKRVYRKTTRFIHRITQI